jgi:ubiquinone/menaquinone biosynthesis C-methylase UbiE
MLDYYAARAPEYDKIYQKPERQADLRAIEAWLEPIFAGAKVLEVACGTGYWTQFIAPAAASVLAVDGAPETFRLAETRVPKEKVQFIVGDAYALPSSEPRCDAAFAAHWLSHVPKHRIGEFLAGLNAVLRPGAKVVLIDNLFVEGSSTPISEHDADGNTYQARPLDDGSVHRVLKNFPTESELRALAADVGTDVAYKAWRHYWALQYTTRMP